jgi:hypothetical protein
MQTIMPLSFEILLSDHHDSFVRNEKGNSVLQLEAMDL